MPRGMTVSKFLQKPERDSYQSWHYINHLITCLLNIKC